MRGTVLLGMVIFISSCSFHSQQTQKETSKKEQAMEERLAEHKAFQEKATTQVAVRKELSEVEKVLAKKIDAETFEADMEIIKESKLYNELTCNSLMYSYNIMKGAGQNTLNLTYKKALDGAKKGSESARRMESITPVRSN